MVLLKVSFVGSVTTVWLEGSRKIVWLLACRRSRVVNRGMVQTQN